MTIIKNKKFQINHLMMKKLIIKIVKNFYLVSLNINAQKVCSKLKNYIELIENEIESIEKNI